MKVVLATFGSRGDVQLDGISLSRALRTRIFTVWIWRQKPRFYSQGKIGGTLYPFPGIAAGCQFFRIQDLLPINLAVEQLDNQPYLFFQHGKELH